MRTRMVNRLANRVALTVRELKFLDALSDATVKVRRGHLIQVAGRPAEHAYFLETGWVMTFSSYADGSRQSRRLHFAGDILGMASMAMRRHAEDIEAITDAIIAPIPRMMFVKLIEDYPRLAVIMFMFAQEERITSGDRLCSLGGLKCKGRLAFFLMDVLTRLRAVDPYLDSEFELPLTREQIGEITGMTSVHVSRMWSELAAERAISSRGRIVTIGNEQRLKSLSNFADRAAGLDFSLVPPPYKLS